MYQLRLALMLLLTLLLLGCGDDAVAPTTLRLVTHDSFDMNEETLAAFEAETGHTLEIVPLGDAGQLVNQSVLSKNNPLGDVIYGIDNTFLSRALENDILLPYESSLLQAIDDSLELDPQYRLLPVDYGDVCLNYDKQWFADANLQPPASLAELTAPAYAGLTVVENPATSSPGLAFLMATVAAFGEDGYVDYWRALRDNDVLVVSGWEEAYYGEFTRYGGSRPIVVSYASSPPAEMIFADTPLDEPPTASVTAPLSCFRQIEFIGILDGTKQEAAARQLVDFLLSERFQNEIPLHMFVFPVNENVTLPDVFARFAQLSDQPATLAPDVIAASRERWLAEWTQVVLR